MDVSQPTLYITNNFEKKGSDIMIKQINPKNRTPIVFDPSQSPGISLNAICDCICNVAEDNNSTGVWKSRLTANIACGCACDTGVQDNKSSNNAKDKAR